MLQQGQEKQYKAVHRSIGKKDLNQPTITSPNVYKNRFIHSMYKYFILVPDFKFREEASSGGGGGGGDTNNSRSKDDEAIV